MRSGWWRGRRGQRAAAVCLLPCHLAISPRLRFFRAGLGGAERARIWETRTARQPRRPPALSFGELGPDFVAMTVAPASPVRLVTPGAGDTRWPRPNSDTPSSRAAPAGANRRWNSSSTDLSRRSEASLVRAGVRALVAAIIMSRSGIKGHHHHIHGTQVFRAETLGGSELMALWCGVVFHATIPAQAWACMHRQQAAVPAAHACSGKPRSRPCLVQPSFSWVNLDFGAPVACSFLFGK